MSVDGERVEGEGAIAIGPVSLLLSAGDPRRICMDGTEVLRRLSYPVRDAQWGTCPVVTLCAAVERSEGGFSYRREFRATDGGFGGIFLFRVEADSASARIVAEVTITAERAMLTNRAGFTLLHPLAGVAGTPLLILRPDGMDEQSAFPDLISPSQPALGIAGMVHAVDGVQVRIAMTGEVFEMEDQRNWSDASFKTYCRPLAAPRPFRLEPGVPLRQSIAVTLARVRPAVARGAVSDRRARGPGIALACEPGLSTAVGVPGAPGLPVLLRLRTDCADASLNAVAGVPDLTLEIVLEDGVAAEAAFQVLAQRCMTAGVRPVRVIALPHAYLSSHQPDGPWPDGPSPADLIGPLRRAFPQAAVGGGSLTLFTEFNRCPPVAGVDFASFGGAAITHAADDLSVLETLEAMPDLFRSAAALAAGKPLHLGLFAIGMRSNPYAQDVVPNPDLLLLPMVRDDPRQGSRFAAAWAVGVLAAAAEAGVASLALAMPDGPLGCISEDRLLPLFHVVRAAARLSGKDVRVIRPGNLVVELRGEAGGIAVNLGTQAQEVSLAGVTVRRLSEDRVAEAASDADWAEGADDLTGLVWLQPLDVLFYGGSAA